MKSRSLKLAFLGVALLFVLPAATKVSDIFFELKKGFTIYSDVMREVVLRYVDDVEPSQLIRLSIDSMLESLDPYTVLINEGETQQMDIMTTGKYAGVGIDIGIQQDRVIVIAPLEGYTAERQGIKAGDEIVEINGLATQELSESEIQELLSGEPGSNVTLKVLRYGIDQPLSFELTRERIDVQSVAYYGFLPDTSSAIGYVKLQQFSQNCAEEVRNALENLNEKKALESVILDLRNNPGGLLDEAVSIVGLFVPQNTEVVSIKGRIQKENQIFRTTEAPLYPDVKVIVLQNEGSASASEIVAGALQDLDRGVIIGTTSFGKGLVQTIRSISYNNALKITSSRYYTPSGRSIQSIIYTHNERKASKAVPDSLKKSFKTQNGRTVYAGNGIDPDIIIESPDPSFVEIALLKDNWFFFYANEYVAREDTVTKDAIVQVEYDRFKAWLSENEFEYTSQSEQYLSLLKEQFPEEKAEEMQQLWGELEVEVAESKAASFDEVKSNVELYLYKELLSRFATRKQMYSVFLPDDENVKTALSTIQNDDEYRRLLNL